MATSVGRRAALPHDIAIASTAKGYVSADRPAASRDVAIELAAVLVAIHKDEPIVAMLPGDRSSADRLPSGHFDPSADTSLEAGLRTRLQELSGLDLGYCEQLCTIGAARPAGADGRPVQHRVLVGYLALTAPASPEASRNVVWRRWYDYFPWEDWRRGRPESIDADIAPRMRQWAGDTQRHAAPLEPLDIAEHVHLAFGMNGSAWDEERVLERYELLTRAGLLMMPEAEAPALAKPIDLDAGRLLATAIGRLRAKIKYRPVVFELMTPAFTLYELQRTVEAILGPHLHKQNFRRLVEGEGLVETTGEVRTRTGGRPAKLYRFRRGVLLERPAPGVRVKAGRN